jgi:metal-responsive CopG/Arc/MetJ family transcriptional regulator
MCYMYDMSTHRISVRIPKRLGQELRQRSQMKGTPESELVRQALEAYLATQAGGQSAYEAAVAAGVVGNTKRDPSVPRDLSTNPKHFKDFGKS